MLIKEADTLLYCIYFEHKYTILKKRKIPPYDLEKQIRFGSDKPYPKVRLYTQNGSYKLTFGEGIKELCATQKNSDSWDITLGF